MKIIVFGASGRTGKEFIQQALKEGHSVTAFVRDPQKLGLKADRLTQFTGDALDQQLVSEAIAGHDSVVSCLGASGLGKTTLLSEMAASIIKGMNDHNVSRIAYTASAGIYKEIPGVRGKMAGYVLRNVLEDHRRAADLLEASKLDWTIARPMRLDDGPLTGQYRKSNEGVPSGGQRISRKDTAHFLLHSLLENAYIDRSVGLAY